MTSVICRNFGLGRILWLAMWVKVARSKDELVEMTLDEIIELLREFLEHHDADGGAD